MCNFPPTCLQPPPPANVSAIDGSSVGEPRGRTLKWRLLTNAPKSRNPTNRIFSNCRTLLRYTINAVTTGTTTAIVQRRESHAASLLLTSSLIY